MYLLFQIFQFPVYVEPSPEVPIHQFIIIYLLIYDNHLPFMDRFVYQPTMDPMVSHSKDTAAQALRRMTLQYLGGKFERRNSTKKSWNCWRFSPEKRWNKLTSLKISAKMPKGVWIELWSASFKMWNKIRWFKLNWMFLLKIFWTKSPTLFPTCCVKLALCWVVQLSFCHLLIKNPALTDTVAKSYR